MFKLRNSPDLSVQNTKAQVHTGHKWNVMQSADQAINRLKHQESVGLLQSGRAGFGWGTAPKMRSKATKTERKGLVISEVVKMEEENYKIKAVSQQQQGSWTTWEL